MGTKRKKKPKEETIIVDGAGSSEDEDLNTGEGLGTVEGVSQSDLGAKPSNIAQTHTPTVEDRDDETVVQFDRPAASIVAAAKRTGDLSELQDQADYVEGVHRRTANRAEEFLCELEKESFPAEQRDSVMALAAQLRRVAYGVEDLVGISTAVEILGVTEMRVRQLAQENRIGRKVGSRYVFSRSELERFAEFDRPVGRPSKDS